MRLLTYQMPDELIAIASLGEFDEFDLNAFFAATGTGRAREFKHNSDVQKWLDIIRGTYTPTQVDNLKLGGSARRSHTRMCACWSTCGTRSGFLPKVASCHAMANLLAETHNIFWHDYTVLTVAGSLGGDGPRRAAARAQGHRQR